VRPWARTALATAAIAAVVVGVGAIFAGLPAAPKNLPTGLGSHLIKGQNVLSNSVSWSKEYSTVSKPTVVRNHGVVEVTYVGRRGDIGVHRKVEVFQGVYRGVEPGQRWEFSVRLRGLVVKTYAIVGMEWFNSHGKWAGETDVYPPLGRTYRRVIVIKTLPEGAKYLAVYVQLAEINALTRIDVTATSAMLVKLAGR
jgi:hypothetical protein